MLYIKKCEYCGEEFYAEHKERKYCSRACSNIARGKHPRRYFDENAPRKVKRKRCKHCGKQFKEGEIRIDEHGIHPAGVDYCCIQCMEAEEGIEVKKGEWRN